MTFNELRRDYLLDRWVVIATERSRRPTDFVKRKREKAKVDVCPLCPGNEHMTPPAVLVYLKSGRKIRKVKDKNGYRHKNWLVRCVPNLYPAFTPPKKTSKERTAKNTGLAAAIGHHEVLIESPRHNEHPADAKIRQLTHVINAYRDRLKELADKPYVRYVSIFRNYGLEAGASLSHAHSQIIATPFIPSIVQEELKASEEFWKRNKRCVFCNIIEKERQGPRLILENSSFVVFTPWASVNPMEFWIFPKKHETSLLDMPPSKTESLAQTIKTCFKALKKVVNDPPYNYGFHMIVGKEAEKYYHWHLEVYPKLAIWAGFEKSTGMYINTVTPETAAKSLRERILR